MADISKIKLPNGSEYNLKDSGAIRKAGDTIVPNSLLVTSTKGTVVKQSVTSMYQSPVPKYLWHDVWAFCRATTPKFYRSTNGTTWTEATVDKSLFAHKEAHSGVTVLDSTYVGARWEWDGGGFAYCSGSWLNFGVGYNNPWAKFDVILEQSDGTGESATWTELVNVTNIDVNQQPVWIKTDIPNSNNLRLTITKNAESSSDSKLRLTSIRYLTPRWGDQGKGSEYEKPYNWDGNGNIYPIANNDKDLGSTSNYWKNGYFTNINGVAVGSSPKFTDTTYTAGTGLELASNKFYNKGAEFIYGTQTAATNLWTGVTTDPELYDGKEIIYFLPFAGNSSNTTLNLTLADGTTTGAKNVYFNSTTRHTNHYGQYQMVRMVYHNSLKIGSTTYSGWWIDYARDTNDTAKYHKTAGVIYKAATVLYSYQICLEVDDTSLVPINTVSNSTATNKTLTTSSFRPFGKILYYGNTSTVNANTNIPDDRLQFNTSINLGYSFNTGSTLTAQTAVYMVCTPQSDGRAKLYSSPITQTLPITDDGKYYIYLGNAISTTNLSLSYHHPVYMYKSGAVREVSQYAEHAGSTSYDSATETLTINL